MTRNAPYLLATSNPGKLRDFAGAAAPFGITIANIPNFLLCPRLSKTEPRSRRTRARKRSPTAWPFPANWFWPTIPAWRLTPRRRARSPLRPLRRRLRIPHLRAESNTDDEANNARVLRELESVPAEKRTARFVCVLAAARDGQIVRTFRGTAEGVILNAPRGNNGFGYDPLFYFPQIGKTFAELSAEEKAQYSHRGAAFRAFLEWYRTS